MENAAKGSKMRHFIDYEYKLACCCGEGYMEIMVRVLEAGGVLAIVAKRGGRLR